jgi:plasmid stability protein
MATLHVRNVPDQLYEMLKTHAQAEGRSLSAEVLMILERALRHLNHSQRDLLQSLRNRQRFSPAKAGAPSSLELLREDRER